MRFLKSTVGVIAATSFAVLAVGALAATTIHDPTGDVVHRGTLPDGVKAADVDITKATAGKAGDRIEMTMSVAGSISRAINHVDTPPEFVVKTGGPTYYGVYPTSGEVVDLNHGGVQPANMTKPNAHTVSATFKPKAIGSPSKYHWIALTGDCFVYDRAPDGTGYAASKSRKRC